MYIVTIPFFSLVQCSLKFNNMDYLLIFCCITLIISLISITFSIANIISQCKLNKEIDSITKQIKL